MTTGRTGAAHIALPFDVQNGPVDRDELWADPTLGAFPSRRTAPDPFFIGLAAKLLRSAKSPLFICGGGVVLSGAEAELAAVAEKLSAPVATTVSGKGSIDERCAHSVGVVGSNGGTPPTRAVVDAADVIVFVGCRAGSVTTERTNPAPSRISNPPAPTTAPSVSATRKSPMESATPSTGNFAALRSAVIAGRSAAVAGRRVVMGVRGEG